MTPKAVDPTNARTEEYAAQLAKIAEAGVCPFCPENFYWHPHPIITRTGGWFLTRIREPYENAEHHFLIICDHHIETLAELAESDMSAIRWLALQAQEVAGNPGGGGLTMRFGATEWTGATVQHLHAHVIFPEIDPQTGRAKAVYFPIG